MKKVKIMLTAITVFAVIGGALAFKAKKFQSTLFCTTVGSDFCDDPYEATFTNNPQPEDITTTSIYCLEERNASQRCDNLTNTTTIKFDD